MLKKFTVSNYRVFENPITLDFTNIRDYKFNEECVKNGLVNKAIIYGKNAVGKTNLGEAILDVTTMIPGSSSVAVMHRALSKTAGFLNANSNEKVARFEYVFQIEDDEIEYIYEKYTVDKIHFESLKINQELLYKLNFSTGEGDFSNFENYEDLAFLNVDKWDDHISILKYILSHAKLTELIVLEKLEAFINGMVNLQTVFSHKMIDDRTTALSNTLIIEKDLVQDFEDFLKEAGVEVTLKVVATPEGKKELYMDYGDKLLRFVDYASSGTLSLVELYSLFNILQSTFLYIDEFDANFHFGLAKLMLEKSKKNSDCQTIITTHNTDLMSNKYMRPDCYLIMTPDKIVNLADATDRELRMGHNLENLYQAGEFKEVSSETGDKDE